MTFQITVILFELFNYLLFGLHVSKSIFLEIIKKIIGEFGFVLHVIDKEYLQSERFHRLVKEYCEQS